MGTSCLQSGSQIKEVRDQVNGVQLLPKRRLNLGGLWAHSIGVTY
ncbi:hypothetical protein SAMN05216299_11076 [Nitrosospira sp. Nsp14]|nr:hypothetical protein SAMN05216299_11076 [Nitrosospira sp. Nsp14]